MDQDFDQDGMDLVVGGKKSLGELEQIVERGLQAFYAAGLALRIIKEEKLYLGSHDNFAAYCTERFDLRRSHYKRLIQAAYVIDNLKKAPIGATETSPIGDAQMAPMGAIGLHNGEQNPLPINERQVRPLTRLKDPDDQADAWQMAIETAPGGRITAKHVASVVAGMLPKPKPAPRTLPNVDTYNPEESLSVPAWWHDIIQGVFNAIADVAETDPDEVANLDKTVAVKSIRMIEAFIKEF
jgi:hypothetical protein